MQIRLRAATNVLGFPGYEPPAEESATARIGRIGTHELVIIEFRFEILGGSMGLATGETVCRAFELATAKGLPVLAITRSGGARMQEGMFALAQMPATLQARDAFRAATGLPFVAWLRHPTTGGVFASFASTADLLVAEPGATIGFAGPRVAEAFTGTPLPAGSHTAESAYGHGLVHALAADEAELAPLLDQVIGDAIPGGTLPEEPQLWAYSARTHPAVTGDAAAAVKQARDPQRRARILEPLELHAYAPGLLHGEREGARIVATTGTPLGVEDYRSFRALLEELEVTGMPLIVLVDMPGADPSADSEAAGIAREIAETMRATMAARIPILAIVTGEGGSGGALALCAGASRLAICRGAYFSVIAPEGAAAILRRSDVEQVARELRCSGEDLVAFGLADELLRDEDVLRAIEHPRFEPGGTTGKDRWRNPGRALTIEA